MGWKNENEKTIIFVIGLVLSLLAQIAQAECRNSYVCDDWGNNCRYMDVCNNVTDLSSTNIDPLPSLPVIDLKPLPSLDLPPLGTSQCEHKQVNGSWQNVCW